MELKLFFLGSSCSAPTKERNLTSIALQFKGKVFLFDCAEGTQQQMMKANVSYMKIDSIFFSHFHADHFLGLPGLLATMNMYERDTKLKIFGPKYIERRVELALKLAGLKPDFDIECIELKKGVVFREKDFHIEAFPVEHGVRCFGFVFKEEDKLGKFMREKAIALGVPIGPLFAKLQEGKEVRVGSKIVKPEQVMDYNRGRRGRKVSIVLDTRASNSYIKYIAESDILVHEAVFASDLMDRAIETFHSTAKEAAEIAKKAKCKRLYLTHFSTRYKSVKQLLEEAREVFKETYIGKDLLVLNLPLNPEERIVRK
ncbi:MAG: ribonuclease Z [Candidatus Iainarchaeum archaeon]|uniref:Ribonuclease Z n=1 Tax=Candidatus Iainarchaeum sp. TaxID=3101447 RepID=A0A497JIL5_9ARCH|nr:MAG: ribonuclease Z [Candidatus Diapherotrites archaeon]